MKPPRALDPLSLRQRLLADAASVPQFKTDAEVLQDVYTILLAIYDGTESARTLRGKIESLGSDIKRGAYTLDNAIKRATIQAMLRNSWAT